MVLTRIGPIIKTAIEYGKRTGAIASGESFVRKYAPPGQRDRLVRLTKAFEQAAGGAGLYQVLETFMNDDGTDSGEYAVPSKVFRKKSNKFYKARYRRRRCTCRRKRQYKRYSGSR